MGLRVHVGPFSYSPPRIPKSPNGRSGEIVGMIVLCGIFWEWAVPGLLSMRLRSLGREESPAPGLLGFLFTIVGFPLAYFNGFNNHPDSSWWIRLLDAAVVNFGYGLIPAAIIGIVAIFLRPAASIKRAKAAKAVKRAKAAKQPVVSAGTPQAQSVVNAAAALRDQLRSSTPASVSVQPPARPRRAPEVRRPPRERDEILDLLERLSQLRDQDVLTDAEFQVKKQELLAEL